MRFGDGVRLQMLPSLPGWQMMTPTNKVLLGSRGYKRAKIPWEHLVSRGFLLATLPPAEIAMNWEPRIMPKILVAVNGSPGSEKALEAAVGLAQSYNARLVAVTVLDHPDGPHVPSLTSTQTAQVRARLGELLQSAANFARTRGLSLTPVLREGHAAEAILACAEEEQADLLVLGVGSRHSDGRGLGSTADRVSKHCPCAVMLVKMEGWMTLHSAETHP